MMVLILVKMLKNLQGVKVDVKEISRKEKFLGKTCTGVWRWEFSIRRTMIVRFPTILYVCEEENRKTQI